MKGRRTGRPYTLAVVVAKHEGQQYLVSMLGECELVKNVRAMERQSGWESGKASHPDCRAAASPTRGLRDQRSEAQGEVRRGHRRRSSTYHQGVHPSRARGTAAHRARYEGDHSRLPAGGSEAPCLPDLVSEYVGPEPLEPMRSQVQRSVQNLTFRRMPRIGSRRVHDNFRQRRSSGTKSPAYGCYRCGVRFTTKMVSRLALRLPMRRRLRPARAHRRHSGS